MVMYAGLAVRMPASFLVMYGGGFTWKERLFFAFAWTPKVSFPIKQLASQPVKQASKQAVSLSIHQLINQSINQPLQQLIEHCALPPYVLRHMLRASGSMMYR